MGKIAWWWLWRKPADLKLATETNGSMFHSKGEWGTRLCGYLQVFLNKYYEENKWLGRSNMLCHLHSFPKRKQNPWIFQLPCEFFLLEGAFFAVFHWVAPLHQAIAVLHQAIFHQERLGMTFAELWRFAMFFCFFENKWKVFDKTKNLTMGGTNHGTFVGFDVQVPHVNHSIFERHELDLGKKSPTNPTKNAKNAKWKGISESSKSPRVSSCTQKKISLFPSKDVELYQKHMQCRSSCLGVMTSGGTAANIQATIFGWG